MSTYTTHMPQDEIKASKANGLEQLKKTMKERRKAFLKKLKQLSNHVRIAMSHNKDLGTKVPEGRVSCMSCAITV